LQTLHAVFEGYGSDHEDTIDLVKGLKDISVNDLGRLAKPRGVPVDSASCFICVDNLNFICDFCRTSLQVESKNPIVDGRFPCRNFTDHCHVLEVISLGNGVIDVESLQRL
jgi:DNA replicative helicase MCM subunit Mcm2 (Cdc46/Mcm family)